MMFVENLEEKEYLNFFKKAKNTHFLQSYAWGESCKKSRNQIPYYVGLKDDKGNILCEALLLKKKFLKKDNAIYLRVNPGIKYQDIDADAKPIPKGENNKDLYKRFVKLGYKHKGFNKLYEGNEPRYTFRLDLTKDFKDVENLMNKTFLKTVRRSYDYDLEIRLSDDIKTFHELIKNNANKDNFHEYSLDFYQNFYETFNNYKQVKIFEAVISPKEVIKKFEDKLKVMKKKISESEASETGIIDDMNVYNRINRDLEFFKGLDNKKDKIVVCSLICVYANKGAWTLYIGNGELGMKTSAINRLYYEAIKDAKENNYNFMDLFGTVGDPKTEYKNLAGLHEFKRKMGGEYIEFIGEFDLVNKTTMYKSLPKLLKVYRKLKHH